MPIRDLRCSPFFSFLKFYFMHIAQLFVLFAGVITALGLFNAVREFITDTLEDYRNSKL